MHEELEAFTQMISLQQYLYEGQNIQPNRGVPGEISSGQSDEQTLREGSALKLISEYISHIGLCTWSQQGTLV